MGAALLAPLLTHRVVESFVRALPRGVVAPQLEELTSRVCEVLGLVALGLSKRDIAGRLVIGEATVETDVSSVLGKLRLRDRAQAVVAACETGLVRPGEAPDQVLGESSR